MWIQAYAAHLSSRLLKIAISVVLMALIVYLTSPSTSAPQETGTVNNPLHH